MSVLARDLQLTLRPDSTRAVLHPFFADDPTTFVLKDHPRAQRIVDRRELKAITAKLAPKHQGTTAIFLRRFNELTG